MFCIGRGVLFFCGGRCAGNFLIGDTFFEEAGDFALDGLELIHAQFGIGDCEDFAGLGFFVDEEAFAVLSDLVFDFEQSFAFEHDCEDEHGGEVLGVVEFGEFEEDTLGGFLADDFGWGWWGFVDALPLGDDLVFLGGGLVFFLGPAGTANIPSFVACLSAEEEGVVGLLVLERVGAALAGVGARLDVPIDHGGCVWRRVKFKVSAVVVGGLGGDLD